MSANSLRFDVVDHVLLVVHADMPPDDGDWSRLVVVRNANRTKIRCNLVIAPPGASINAAQRADVAQYMRANGTSIAVVTDSALVRGAARAVGSSGVQVCSFSPTELASALNYLFVPASKHADMFRRIDALKAQLASNASSDSQP